MRLTYQVTWFGILAYKFSVTCISGKKDAFKAFQKVQPATRALLLAPAEGFGLRPRLFLPFGQKKRRFFMLFWLPLGHFWCSVVTSVTFSSNLSNWECHLSIVPKMGTSDIHVQSAQNLKISKTNPKKIFFPSFF